MHKALVVLHSCNAIVRLSERVCSGVCSNVTKVKPVEMQPPHGRRASFVVFKHNEVQALFFMYWLYPLGFQAQSHLTHSYGDHLAKLLLALPRLLSECYACKAFHFMYCLNKNVFDLYMLSACGWQFAYRSDEFRHCEPPMRLRQKHSSNSIAQDSKTRNISS
jgi:hypothetical protein